jgi:thymidylate kinase
MRESPQRWVPDRTAVLAATAEAMSRSGRRWAWQGPVDATARWLLDTGPKDLDLWYDTDSVDAPADADPDAPVASLRAALSCASVADSRHPGRPRHVSLAVETPTGAAVVDLTCGDLRVGPVLLVPAGEIGVDPVEHRFTGASAVADLLVRPILRGRWPEPARLAEAQQAWASTDDADRRRLLNRLAAQLGVGVAARLAATLDGARPDPTLPRRARARLVARSLVPANLAATWAQRRTVVPAGAAAGPLGLRVRGVVVAVVGTDGAGKSTVVDGLDERLRRYGLRTGSAYFGMARGNLPGVNLARRLLGVSTPETNGSPAAQPMGTRHPYLRRAADWFYAGEYLWRYFRVVAPQRSRRRVVIVDRWVYDLRESPWPGSGAARAAQRLVPDPDVLVLPDAPAELIHARKPERLFAEQAAQQERYRRLLAERPARFAEVVVDTTGGSADPLRELVAVVVEAVHGVRGRSRRR